MELSPSYIRRPPSSEELVDIVEKHLLDLKCDQVLHRLFK
jgi:hypothetical protein